MSSQYKPQDHILPLKIAPRAESVLDQREITIQSYQTTVPFNLAALKKGLHKGWLSSVTRFGIFSDTGSCDTIKECDHAAVVLGLQDELSVRAYDYKKRCPLWYSWQDIIVDTISMRYSRNEAGMLRFTTTGGGRRITKDMLDDFNLKFLGIPKEAVSMLQFDLDRLRELCFGQFINNLYMVKFKDPSGKEYRSIDHALFKSRQYINPNVERLREVRDDSKATIESFDSDVTVHPEALSEAAKVRFDIRGTSGSLRLRFPKLVYKSQLSNPREQARVFYDIVDVTVKSIMDGNCYIEHHYSLDDLKSEIGLFPDNVNPEPFKEVLLRTNTREQFFTHLDLGLPWSEWLPHLRAIDELLEVEKVAQEVKKSLVDLAERDCLQANKLLDECIKDAKICRVGHIAANVLMSKLHSFPAEYRSGIEETLLAWAVKHEFDGWDVDPESGWIKMRNLRWELSDLSVNIFPQILWRLVAVLHGRLLTANGDTVSLLHRFNWCMTAAKDLPTNYFDPKNPLRLVVGRQVPTSVADGDKILKEPVDNLSALDEAVLDQFVLPLWPFFDAYYRDEQVVLDNIGVGAAIGLKITSNETLFGEQEIPDKCNLLSGQSVLLPIAGRPKTLDVQFSKFGKQYHITLQLKEDAGSKQTLCPNNEIVEQIYLTDPETTVLYELQKIHGQLINRKTIVQNTRISDGAMKTILKKFEDLELAHRPQGERMGYTITPKGTSLYHKLHTSSQ